MKTIRIKLRETGETSIVVCRKHAIEEGIPRYLAETGKRELFVFTDENVYRLYRRRIAEVFNDPRIHVMPAGEQYKTSETLFALLEEMAQMGLHRNSVLVALGGGVVGDIGGLAAALYMRGISCIQVPTTLLAQVDSSVGGKTAVDFAGVKNLVGVFRQSELVLADPTFFETLPPREIRCGLGEIVKHGALDGNLFDLLWEHRDGLADLEFLSEIVPLNIAFKADIVEKDPHEVSLRKCLNLGHTTAHALELSDGTLSHGEYVLIGTVYEARLARKLLKESDPAYLDRLETLCRSVLECDIASFDVERASEKARLDKKNTSSDGIVVTVPVRKGEYALLELTYEDYVRELSAIRGELC